MVIITSAVFAHTEWQKLLMHIAGQKQPEFRHSYAQFFPMIVEMAKNEEKYNLDYLSNNLESIKALVSIIHTQTSFFLIKIS